MFMELVGDVRNFAPWIWQGWYFYIKLLGYEASKLDNHSPFTRHPIIPVRDETSDDENPWRTLQKVVKER